MANVKLLGVLAAALLLSLVGLALWQDRGSGADGPATPAPPAAPPGAATGPGAAPPGTGAGEAIAPGATGAPPGPEPTADRVAAVAALREELDDLMAEYEANLRDPERRAELQEQISRRLAAYNEAVLPVALAEMREDAAAAAATAPGPGAGG